jgi:ERCC4-related helicase
MEFYWKTEQDERPRVSNDPLHFLMTCNSLKILGLTASPAGEVQIDATRRKIKLLEENLNSKIQIVLDNREELENYVSYPATIPIEVEHSKEALKLIELIQDQMKARS